MERRLELEKLKAVYEESKHVTKAVELDGKIIRLRSTLCKFLEVMVSTPGSC